MRQYPPTRWLRACLPAAALVGLSACASWPKRPDLPATYQAQASVPGFGTIRRWSDAPAADWAVWRAEWEADRARAGVQSGPALLALSSGSDKGAFGAGYLAGWTARGDRPNFDVVTGVSTGALIAPFAFLGPDQDATLREIYTGIDARDIYRVRPLRGLTGGPSFADNKPLARLIDRYLTPGLLDRIGEEHRRGRRLLIATTNLDAERGVIWDIGAIAVSRSSDRLTLARRVLLASASIPGIFPPVLIDAEAGAHRFQEMHVDGGTAGSVFGLPPAVIWGGRRAAPSHRNASITIIYNGKLARRYEVVQPRAFTIVGRALTTLISENDRGSLAAYRAFAAENNVAFQIAAIGEAFDAPSKSLFDRAYMRRLYNYGLGQAAHPTAPTRGETEEVTNETRH